jgi:holo-[acyl-carrier protein] synthase
MIVGIGVDLVDCRRIEKMIAKFGQRFLERVFTQNERDRCERRSLKASSYGKIFAAKEAVVKALGTGEGMSWQDIEINRLPSGKPWIKLYGNAAGHLKTLIPESWSEEINLSLTDEWPYAQAFVVISKIEKVRIP